MIVYQKVLIFSKTLFAQFLHQRASKDQENLDYNTVNDPNHEYYKMHKRLVKMNKVKDVKSHEILVLLLRLRQICCHLSLITEMFQAEDLGSVSDIEECEEMDLLDQLNKLDIEDVEEDAAVGLSETPVDLKEATKDIFRASNPIFAVDRLSSKIKAVLTVLKENVLTTDDKAVVISQWTGLLQLIAIQLKNEGIKFVQLDGKVPVPKRMGMVEDFNNPKHEVKVSTSNKYKKKYKNALLKLSLSLSHQPLRFHCWT